MRYLRNAKPKELAGTALVRLDFNTEDDWRMEASIPTVKFLMKYADKVIVISHRGRPSFVNASENKLDTKAVKEFTLAAHAKKLEKLLKHRVVFVPQTHFADISFAVARAPSGSVLMLENLRFWSGEGDDDPAFAHSLAALADYYINDAFAVSHRRAASIAAITQFLPSYAGFGLESELHNLSRLREHAKHPFVIVVGGGKAKDKLGVIHEFKRTATTFLVGGASGNSMLKMRGVNVKKSLVDDDPADQKMLSVAAHFKNLLVPVDWREENRKILDIGPKTEKMYADIIKNAKTILWAGPMGLIEKAKFRKGSLAIAKAIAANRKAFSVTGGGETVMFLKKYKLDKKFSFISTGGGALLEYLGGEELPGIQALQGKPVAVPITRGKKSVVKAGI